MTLDDVAEEERRWWRVVRRALGVPEIVKDDTVAAVALLRRVPDDLDRDEIVGDGTRSPGKELLEKALDDLLRAFVGIASEGEVDRAIGAGDEVTSAVVKVLNRSGYHTPARESVVRDLMGIVGDYLSAHPWDDGTGAPR